MQTNIRGDASEDPFNECYLWFQVSRQIETISRQTVVIITASGAIAAIIYFVIYGIDWQSLQH